MIEVRLPATSEDITESLVVFWHRTEGDLVEQGEVLVEVQTEKAVFEVEAPVSGRLDKIQVKRGEVAAVGDVLAWVEQVSSPQASPRVRKLARELGIDLSTVAGTGPGGRLTEEDIQNASQRAQTVSFVEFVAADNEVPQKEWTADVTPIRRTIAKRMMQSLQETAQLTLTAWADVTYLAEQRKQLAPNVSWNTWILRAVVLALGEHPNLNAVWEDSQIRRFDHVHLGVAADTSDGLLVPSIKYAEQLNLLELHTAVSQLVQKAQEGKLSSSELSGSTFTVTNLGSYGIQFFTPILNPPEAAILGVGQIEPHVMFQDRNLLQRERLPLSLTFDHRMVDGAPAARFLQTIVRLLEIPEGLL
jgi:pyruvate dehydrogenase E2 component (dihydrolipoamide acetyltransferase)